MEKMTDEQILKKAIEKVVQAGLRAPNYDICYDWDKASMETKVDYFMPTDYEYGGYEEDKTYNLIFSHSFAKAFWGEPRQVDCEVWDGNRGKIEAIKTEPGWKHHLQQMVLEEEPLRYLEKFL